MDDKRIKEFVALMDDIKNKLLKIEMADYYHVHAMTIIGKECDDTDQLMLELKVIQNDADNLIKCLETAKKEYPKEPTVKKPKQEESKKEVDADDE